MTTRHPTMRSSHRPRGYRMLIGLALIGAAAAASGVASKRASAAGGRIACNVTALADDPDPNGVNVRARPTTKSRVIAQLRNRRAGGGKLDVRVSVRGQQGGWFEIAGASGGRVAFRGRGWVHGSRLAVQLRGGAALRASPRPNAKVVAKAPGRESFPKISGCAGRWVRVRRGGTSGWVSFNDYCAATETTCS